MGTATRRPYPQLQVRQMLPLLTAGPSAGGNELPATLIPLPVAGR